MVRPHERYRMTDDDSLQTDCRVQESVSELVSCASPSLCRGYSCVDNSRLFGIH